MERIERSRRRGLPRPTPEPQPATPRPTTTESRPQTQPARGVAAALGQTAQRVADTLSAARTAVRVTASQVTGTLQRAGQTIATGARTIARRAGEFAAWTERQSEELFRGKVTPQTIAGTAASLVLPTTTMQIIGGQRRLDVRDPNTAIGLGSDVLLMMPVVGAVARAARAGSTAAGAARVAKVAETATRSVPTRPAIPPRIVIDRLPRPTRPAIPPRIVIDRLPRPTPPALAIAQVGANSYFINSLSSVYIW